MTQPYQGVHTTANLALARQSLQKAKRAMFKYGTKEDIYQFRLMQQAVHFTEIMIRNREEK